MSDRESLMITGHDAKATCVACGKIKECIQLDSSDGSIRGWLCVAHLKMAIRMRQSNGSRPDRGTPLFDASANHFDSATNHS